MRTSDWCIEKYRQLKAEKGGVAPAYAEFLKYAEINKRQLDRLFGSSPFSKLQEQAGDPPNKLRLERTSTDTIMRQYGSLVTELNKVPAYAAWDHRGLKPSASGLRKRPHNLLWSDLPDRFLQWVEANRVSEFGAAVQIVKSSVGAPAVTDDDSGFTSLVAQIRNWAPARRRTSEETYKVELRKHLESLRLSLNEEFGQSRCDLLVGGRYAIEIKKDPDLGEYDRLFGQLARHLRYQRRAVALIFDTTADKYNDFCGLVDEYFNRDETLVQVVKR